VATALQGTVLVVGVASFGDLRRTNNHQVTVRRSLYRILSRALTESGVDWKSCHREDRGDGILVVIPPAVPKNPLAESLPGILVRLLDAHNAGHPVEEQIRLRMALHAGEVHFDARGVAGRAATLAFRLVDAKEVEQAQTDSVGSLVLITSALFHEEVVRPGPAAGFRQVALSARETSVTAWMWLPSVVGGVRQLPTNVRQFAGREPELDRLTHLLDEATTATVIITAIDGSAGIGKTTLALHWAHSVKDRFPDGQLHVNLRGFDPGEPMDAGQALHEFLQALGVAPKGIPAELNAKAAMYRSRLADKRILIMLDNARSVEHVKPLLPGTSSCLVVITSRNRLDRLSVYEGAARIALDIMSTAEATALLGKRMGHIRLAAEPDAVTDIIDLCASLPLALSIVAARAADYPDVSLRTLVRELRQERHRLDALDRGDQDLSVRAVFSWSYEVLSPEAARLFRLLGVHAGPDIEVAGSDALAGEPTRGLLDELIRAHMLAEYVPGRYRFHDLLREYAAELSRLRLEDE
jgi:NB-ARC domain